jgi:putative RNA 2'-phosphotransferase
MEPARRTRISKWLALALRHEPAALDLALDDGGFAPIEAVLAGFAAHGEAVTRAELLEIVATSEKQRFALSADEASVRARQGHSIAVDLGLRPVTPPEQLFHGTPARNVESILRDGLRAGARAHVHLSEDRETATVVARRRAGPHALFVVDAAAMARAGLALFRSENGVWLTAHVPAAYLARLA